MPPGHPERVERAEVMNVVASQARARGYEVTAPHPASTEQLARVHAPEYIARIAETAGRAVALDPDTYTSAESHGIALLAAGAGRRCGEAGDGSGTVERPFPSRRRGERGARDGASARPPCRARPRDGLLPVQQRGGRGRPRARGRRGASRDRGLRRPPRQRHAAHVRIRSRTCCTSRCISFRSIPAPARWTKSAAATGTGFTVNLPLEVGAVDEDYRLAFSEVVVPVLRQYDPDLLLVSAGFDAHERDPLAGMRLTSGAFAAMTMELRKVAEECSDGRLVLVTEGGYDLRALAESLEGVVESLAAPTTIPRLPEMCAGPRAASRPIADAWPSVRRSGRWRRTGSWASVRSISRRAAATHWSQIYTRGPAPYTRGPATSLATSSSFFPQKEHASFLPNMVSPPIPFYKSSTTEVTEKSVPTGGHRCLAVCPFACLPPCPPW